MGLAGHRIDGRAGLSVVVADHFTGFQFVSGAAIRAFGFAGFGHVQIDLRVAVPEFHVCFGVGAKHTALGVQVGGQQFNRMAHCLLP